MNLINPITFFAILFLLFLFWLWRRVECKDSQKEGDWLPDELKAGKLVMVEKQLYTHGRFNLVARMDRVYEVNNQGITCVVPADFKRRSSNQVFDTDRAELSLQAWVLRHNNHTTAKYGYIFLINEGQNTVSPRRVALNSDEECETMMLRYLDLRDKRVEPSKALKHKCKGCPHKQKCNR